MSRVFRSSNQSAVPSGSVESAGLAALLNLEASAAGTVPAPFPSSSSSSSASGSASSSASIPASIPASTPASIPASISSPPSPRLQTDVALENAKPTVPSTPPVPAAPCVNSNALDSAKPAHAGEGEAAELGRIGPHILRAAIPHQGLGRLFKAWDAQSLGTVAVTVLELDADVPGREDTVTQLQQGLVAVAAFVHPRLVRIVDAGVLGEGVYVATEWLPGRTLGQALRSGWLPNVRQAATLVMQLAEALAYVHEQGVVHGGLNPGNVLLGEHNQPKITGLGYACAAYASSVPTLDPLVSGAAPYLAPEQLQGGAVDARTDIHALGVLLYELLAGHRAYPGDAVPDIVRALLHHDPTPPHWLKPAVPERLSAIAMQALQRHAAARYDSASEVAAALKQWLQDDRKAALVDVEEEDLSSPSPAPGVTGSSRKAKSWAAAGLLALASVAVLASWANGWWGRSPDGAGASASGTTVAAAGAVAAPGAVLVGTSTTAAPASDVSLAHGATPAENNGLVPAGTRDPVAGGLGGGSGGGESVGAGVDTGVDTGVVTGVGAGVVTASLPALESPSAAATVVAQDAVATSSPLGAAQAVPSPSITVAQRGAPGAVTSGGRSVEPSAVVSTPASTAAVRPNETRAKPARDKVATSRSATNRSAPNRSAPNRSAAADNSAAAAAPAMGIVKLAISPWGYVEVGGRLAGATPPLNSLSLPTGTHTITVRNQDFVPFVTTVQVSADKTPTVRHRFEP